MAQSQRILQQTALWCMLLSATAVVLSIAASQILLGLALIAFLASGTPLRLPPIQWPLLAFMGWTLVSLAASPDAAGGLPQVRKFFVYVAVPLVASGVLLDARHARWLAGGWVVAAALSAVRSLVQFWQKVEGARARGEDFYQFYIGERITGFLSHWMTFSGVGMMVLLVLLSVLFFAPGLGRRSRWLGWLGVLLLVASLLVSFTRGIWVATGVAVLYLVWGWRRKLLWAAPAVVVVAVVASPSAVRRRVESMVTTQGDTSASARVIMWRTGWRMIQDRPLVGVGPQQVGPQFRRYLPGDVVGELPPAFYEHLHSLYIHYAAERGVPALAAIGWLLVAVLRDHWRALRRGLSAENRYVVQAVVAVSIGVAVEGVFELNLGDSEVLTVFLTLVSLGYTAIQREMREAASG
jgi:O-antigen ligase